MKKFFTILVLFSQSYLCQELLVEGSMEILPQTQNFGSSEQVTFTVEPQNTVAYCQVTNPPDPTEWYTDNASTSQLTITGNYIGSSDEGPGFDACYSQNLFDPFWLTLNKIIITYEMSSFYFYIDYRDCGYGTFGQDITIRYVYNDGYYISPGLNTNSNLTGFQSVSLGQVFRIGEINSYGSFETDCMDNYWSNCLVMLDNPGFPTIVWGPHPTFSPVSGYKIYRKVVPYGQGSGNPLTFPLLTTVSASTFSYIDYEYTKGGQYYNIYYYV